LLGHRRPNCVRWKHHCPVRPCAPRGAPTGQGQATRLFGAELLEEPPRRGSSGVLRSEGGLLAEPHERLRDGTSPRRSWREKTPESVRNAERGTNREVGRPGWLTSLTPCAEGEETLREPASCVSYALGGRLRPYSEEEAEAQERRALWSTHCASRQPGTPQEPTKAAGGGLKPK
jgi:hypothetical protein